MNTARRSFLILIFAFSVATAGSSWLSPACLAMPSSEPRTSEASGRSAARHIGSIKAIAGNVITLTPDSGPEIDVTVQATTHIVRIAPGEKTLKNATPVQLQDLQVGDRVLVAGKASGDAKAITVVHPSKATVIRRYAPDSMKFDDAKSSTLQEIQPGDQLRARGNRSSDGTELAAEEIVTGSFRNVAGIVSSVDASAGTMDVQDLLSKKLVQITVTPDSQLHQLPPEIAQRIAMRLRAAMAGATGGTAGPGAQSGAASSGGTSPGAGPGGGMAGGMRPGGAPDFQQILNRMPVVALTDLHKGDAVMIVATPGTPTSGATAITLLSGVEAILQAAPSGSQAMMLSPWSLGSPGGGDALGQ